MKNNKHYFIMPLVLFLILFLMTSGAEAFHPYGIQAQGMGGAYAALGDDVAAIYYNPAALEEPLMLGAGLSGTIMIDELDLDSLENIYNLYSDFSLDDFDPDDLKIDDQRFTLFGMGALHARSFMGFMPAVAVTTSNQLSFEDQDTLRVNSTFTDMVNLRYRILDPPLDVLSITVGSNLKRYRTEEYEYVLDPINDEVTEESSDQGQGFGFDLGARTKITDMVTVGVSARDLFSSVKWEDGNSENIPASYRAGVSASVPLLAFTVAGDIENFENNDQRYNRIHLGFEKGFFFNTLQVRGGSYTRPETDSIDQVFTGGLGINMRAIRADFNLLSQDDLLNISGGSLSIGVSF